jgi:hypothetical protein
VKFRRSKPGDVDETPENEAGAGPADTADPRSNGPFDSSEVEIDDDAEDIIDLGALKVRATPGVELQMQVDEASGQVIAVLIVAPDGALELRPFAAPRGGDIWADVMRSIAAEVTQGGGTATRATGLYGPELHLVLNVKDADGRTGQQQSRVVGIVGPRWLLRATFYGRPAVQPDPDAPIETALRNVIVVRGTGPMPPGDALPMALPPNATPAGG